MTMTIIFLLTAGAAQAAGQEIIPADHLPLPGTWESAGVEGGIPNLQTIYTDITQAQYSADNTGSISAVTAQSKARSTRAPAAKWFIYPREYTLSMGGFGYKNRSCCERQVPPLFFRSQPVMRSWSEDLDLGLLPKYRRVIQWL